MSSKSSNSTVYVGNLDERVSERALYDILIQAGRVVDLHIPRDKDSDRPKGYAFAEYETPEIADYAVRLFSGLLTLHNRTLKFAISGQDKVSHNTPPATATATATTPASNSNSAHKPRSHPAPINHAERISASFRLSSHPSNYHQVNNHSNGYGSHYDGNNFEHGRRIFGSTLDSMNRSRSRRFDSSDPVSYPSY